MKSVILTSAGRRVSLLRAFQQAGAGEWRTIAADADPLAPTLHSADTGFVLPRLSDPTYWGTMTDLLSREHVRLLIPTIDTELLQLAESRHALAGRNIVVPISDPEFITITRDKWFAGQRFAELGIDVPISWLPQDLPDRLPRHVFLKPRDGSASIDASRVSRDLLSGQLQRLPNAIVQEILDGPEITVDALFDLDSRPIHYVPRRRIKTLAGESIIGATFREPAVDQWLESVLPRLGSIGARGPLTLQAFLTSRGPVLSEVNARFGGGFPLGHAAGADYPRWLLQMAEGRAVPPRLGDYEPNLQMTRHAVEIFLRQPGHANPDKSKVPGAGVVFDLDDTLFLERDYVRSGFQAVARHLHSPEAFEILWQDFENGARQDSFNRLIEQWPDLRAIASVKEMVHLYRTHLPSLSLAPGARRLLAELREQGCRIGVITDGEVASQSRKAQALGLWPLVDDIIFTGYWGTDGAKPSTKSFQTIASTWNLPPERLTYIADNPKKDFFAPRQLGWSTIRLRCAGQLYRDAEPHESMFAPHREITSLAEFAVEAAA